MVEKDISWIPGTHYSGMFGYLKLTLPKQLPESVDKVIVLDTDLVLTADIALLWREFDSLEADGDRCFGIAEEQATWYLPNSTNPGYKTWPALGIGFNTGVMLMHLARLR